MITVPIIKRAISLFCVAVIFAGIVMQTALAYEPYDGYNYDWWGDPVPSQNGYVPEFQVRGDQIAGAGSFSEPNDLFLSSKNEFYVVDTKNNRIVVLDKDLNFLRDYRTFINKDGSETTLNEPKGIYVDENGNMYIADTLNERVIGCDSTGNIFITFMKPTNEVYPQANAFNPVKVLVDKSENVFILAQGVTMGAVMYTFDRDSDTTDFKGFYGTNRVQATAAVIANKSWTMILTREQMMARTRAVPAEFENFDIDSDGFIYTVTRSQTQTTGILKKLNPAGYNIFDKAGYDDYYFGDWGELWYNGKTYKSEIIDVDVADNGLINIIDYETKRVFQYSEECDLLFVFGGAGNQLGLFTYPVAVESLDQRVYVLDMRKNNITVFKRTTFGEYVHTAVDLFQKGRYDEAIEPWEEVLRRDGNYWFAYIGIGNALMNKGEFKEAMEYFKFNHRRGYSRAFKEYRAQVLKDNFELIIGGIVVIWIGSLVLVKYRKKKKLARNADRSGGNKS